MSGQGAPAAPPPGPMPGPMEIRAQFLWNETWDKLSAGEHFRYFAVQCEAEIAFWRTQAGTFTPAQIVDFNKADNLHRSHVESLNAVLAERDRVRSEWKGFRNLIVQEISKINFYAFQSLGIANGAVVLAPLGYIGQSAIRPVPPGLLAVVVLAGVGFFLNL